MLLTIDFEASCLPRDGRSYPIEIGIADLAGWSRSWLIRPEPAWAGWCWTAEAEALHGISPALLAEAGRPAGEVMAELNAAVGNQRVLADHDLDRGWLATLAAATGIAAGFTIGHIRALLDELRPTAAAIERAVAEADRRVPQRHRARADARWLAEVAGALTQPVEDAPAFPWGARAMSVAAVQPAA